MEDKLQNQQVDTTFIPELNREQDGSLFYKIYKGNPPHRIIHETANFAVLCDIAPLLVGHLIIVPKWPWVSFGKLPKENWDEYAELKLKAKRVLDKCYSRTMFIEHGSCSTMVSGGCITHAHLHAVPGSIDFLPMFSEYGLEYIKIHDMRYLLELGNQDVPYLFFENTDSEMYVVQLRKPIKKQFVRIGIAKSLGIEDPYWDWGVYVNKAALRKTIKEMKQIDWQTV